MAKQSYKIPDSLDKTFADLEITVQNKDGIGARPIPIKQIVLYVVSILACFWFLNKTFMGGASFGLRILMAILWIFMTMVLLKKDGTGLMQYTLVKTMLDYIPKAMRYVVTRNNAKANEFYKIAGIKSIDERNGLIEYEDGTYGYVYGVVGTGSVLLFEADRDAILDRVDNFYRKMKTEYEMIFITSKEPQKVEKQLAHFQKIEDNLEVRDPDLIALAKMQREYIKDYVGGRFRSIHQYLIIKADNLEALTVGKNMLQAEVEGSSLMIKHCTALFDKDIYELLRTIYRGKESV